MEENIQFYIDNTVKKEQKFHSKKATIYKRNSLILKITTLVLSSLIPLLLAVFKEDSEIVNYLLAFIGFFLVLIEGVKSELKYHEKWLLYRTTSEDLKRELSMFLALTDTSNKKEVSSFVKRINYILDTNNVRWKKTLQSTKKEDV